MLHDYLLILYKKYIINTDNANSGRLQMSNNEDIVTGLRGYRHGAARISSQGREDILKKNGMYTHRAVRM